MNNPAEQRGFKRAVKELSNITWPRILASDSELQRRKKVALRCAHLAMAAMIAVPIITSLVANSESFGLKLGLIVACPVYIVWCLYGMREVVLRLFQNKTEPGTAVWSPRPPFGKTNYFTVQIVLAATICYLSGDAEDKRLVWLVLLVPIAQSVVFLNWIGILIVSVLNMGALAVAVANWYGWKDLPNALLAFSFAVLFTIIFTLLAVSSEKSRSQMEALTVELSQANNQLRQHATQVEELTVTRERNRLAREIHDSLGHYLTVVNVQIEAARTLLDQDLTRAKEALAKAKSYTQEGLQDVRRSVATLRTSPLDNKSLVEALQQIVDENNVTGLETKLQVLGNTRSLSSPAELTLYRAGQEALTNVRKHAQARKADIVLNFESPTEVALVITDDGCGTKGDVVDGFGLLGLRERAQLLGGQVNVRTGLQAGFALEIKVPG